MPEIRGRTLRPLRAAALGVMLLALGACGSDDAGLAAGPTSALRDQVVAVRAAATTGNVEAARSALDAFRAQVHRLVESGELDPADAVELLAQADRVGTGLETELNEELAGPTPKPTPRPVVRSVRQQDRSEWSDVLAALIRDRISERDDAWDDRRDRHDRDGREGRGNHDDDED